MPVEAKFDVILGKLREKDSGTGGGAVDSVNGQTGVVVLTATDIGSSPIGAIAATNVQGAIQELDSEKAPTVHTHTSSQITDLQEFVEDTIGTKVVAGSNVTVTYNDTTGETTIASTASGGGSVPQVLAARIYRSTNQSIPTGGTYTDISFSTAAYEQGGEFWSSGSTITIPEPGYFQVFAETTFDGTGLLAIATANMQVIHNGSTVILEHEDTVAINAKAQLFGMAQRYFTAGDTVKMQVKHSDPGSVNILAQGDHSPDIILVRVGGSVGLIQSQTYLSSGGFQYTAVSRIPNEILTNATWRVFRKQDTTGTITRADGDRNFDNPADNLPSLTYT